MPTFPLSLPVSEEELLRPALLASPRAPCCHFPLSRGIASIPTNSSVLQSAHPGVSRYPRSGWKMAWAGGWLGLYRKNAVETQLKCSHRHSKQGVSADTRARRENLDFLSCLNSTCQVRNRQEDQTAEGPRGWGMGHCPPRRLSYEALSRRW